MAEKNKGKFSYFYGDELDSDVSSDSEDDEIDSECQGNKIATGRDLAFITKSEEKLEKEEIPSAKVVLEKKNARPEFLKDKTKDEINWERLTKDNTVFEEEIDLSNTHAIPPPTSYESQSENTKPTLGDNSEATGQAKEAEKRAYSVTANEDGDGLDAVKKSKQETAS